MASFSGLYTHLHKRYCSTAQVDKPLRDNQQIENVFFTKDYLDFFCCHFTIVITHPEWAILDIKHANYIQVRKHLIVCEISL